MNGEAPVDAAEQRKSVCKALTRVVRRGPLSGELDAKAFFMMLNANYSVLYRDGLFDLTPVWEALAQTHSTDQLTGLFLRFAETLQEEGLRAVMPPQVAGLTPQEQLLHLQAFDGGEDVEAEIVPITNELEVIDEDDPPPPMLELNTGDLKPFLPPEMRRAVVQTVVQSVKAAPIGDRVDSAQLAYLVDGNFDQLCDGRTFDAGPVLAGLRDLGDVPDRDIYLAVDLMQERLPTHDLTLVPVELDVSDAEAQQIRTAYEEAQKQLRREQKKAITATVDMPPPTPSPPIGDAPRQETKETKLREMGLGQRDNRLLQRIRIAVLAVALIGIGGASYLLRPDRPVSITPYAGTVPLKAARLVDNNFVGTLDDGQWWALSLDERTRRLSAFEKVARTQGVANQLQVRDNAGRLVITSVGQGHLRGAPFLMLGRADGSLIERPEYEDVSDANAVRPPPRKKTEDRPPPAADQ